jgi:formylmethanofuran dehydrogenase subunit B
MALSGARKIACPFCGLACDDLLLREGGEIDTRGCPKAKAGFARAAGETRHFAHGAPVALGQAAEAAAAILRAARQPLITGLGADLAGQRALLALADRTGAVIDRWQSAAQLRNLAVTEETGAFLATFGEVANRADVALLIGGALATDFPRFFERLLAAPQPLYRSAPPWVAYLGPAPDPALPIAENISAEPASLAEALGGLSTLVAGRKLAADRPGGVAPARLEAVAARLKAARYGAIIWDAAIFPAPEGEIAVRFILEILRNLNLKTRAVGLPLGGSDNAQGASQAMLWQAGWPGRISYARGVPEHDPWRNDSERVVAAGETDALLWVAATSPNPPPKSAAPTIALVAGDVALDPVPAVAIRVGIPAIDHAGTVIRADGVIALPLDAARPSKALPTVAEAAHAILDAMGLDAMGSP